MNAEQPDSVSAHLSLRLTQHIQAELAVHGGWLPFDRFMALALYTPGLGYYANDSRKFGLMPESGSDFVTAPELSPLFGATLAMAVREALQASQTDEICEFGAGSGALAEQVLEALTSGDAGTRLRRYTIVDLSGSLRARQQERLARFADASRAHPVELVWADTWPEAFAGVVLGNEVLDAMPVQLMHKTPTGWQERGVVAEGSGFAWADRPAPAGWQLGSEPRFADAMPPGTVTEIHPQAEAFVRSLAEHLQRGVAFFIDYGFPEAEYYHPERHMGTLMCHRAHRSDTNPLVDVGLKDLTAHVNFTGIALAGQDAGLDVLGYTSQGRFLLNSGLLGLLANTDIATRANAQKLFLEHEMGEFFKVVAFGRGLPEGWGPQGFEVGDRSHML